MTDTLPQQQPHEVGAESTEIKNEANDKKQVDKEVLCKILR